MDKFIEIRAVLLPDKNLLEKSLNMAKSLSKNDGLIFAVDNNKFIPHITIYDAEFPESNYENVLQVGEGFKGLLPLNLVFDKFFCGWGYVGIGFQKTEAVFNFHKQVINRLNSLRNGHLREKYANNKSELVMKYGYHNVMENFEPHLTFARFTDVKKAESITKELNKTKLQNFTTDSFALTETGENGTVTKIIKCYSSASS